MNSFELSIEVSEPYDFKKESLPKIEQNRWVKNQWPLVYFIQNNTKKIAYVGESTNAASRIRDHLSNPERYALNKISIIGCDKFNKSVTLEIESNLIQYISSEETFKLQNGNQGLVNHNYYQKDLYKNIFKEVWNKLLEKKIVTKSLSEIENTELFKYSPYKSLNEDQYESVLNILEGLSSKKTNRIFISGSAGTGKTIVATYLMKLLTTNVVDSPSDDFNEDELGEINYVKAFQAKYPNAKIGLVVAMTSLRNSLKDVFRKIPGLKSSMVISPSDTFKCKYDLLIVDEAHRLRQYKNLGWMGAFKKNNQKLGLDDSGTELDWILANSKNQIFFYDWAQSVKPSDVDAADFENLLKAKTTLRYELKSQMRVNGGNGYIKFVEDLLHCTRNDSDQYSHQKYDLLLFDSFIDLHNELTEKENEFELCRMIAGYSWPWLSDPKKKPKPSPSVTDIELDDLKFKWNSTPNNWVNSKNAFKEIGCIHTTQGYDLNYSAVIFGKEINYNKEKKRIEIDPNKYLDIYGKKGVSDPALLEQFIINIYKTIMCRGIRGTFVYAYNKEMREYLKNHIKVFELKDRVKTSKKEFPFRILKKEDVNPYVNSIPFIDIAVAAGKFSDLQKHGELTWIEPPFNVAAKEGYFICKVVGESMNKKIQNGTYCLFKRHAGGTRNGEIVLVQSTNINDSEFGSGYTVKQYHSKKNISEDEWEHESIILKPLSNDNTYSEIQLSHDELNDFKVIGIFEKILS
jgi:DUF2075 family protein/DNA replication protein DnaC